MTENDVKHEVAMSFILNKGPLKTIKGLYTLNVLYDIMCFEFEIPNRMKSKNLNVINEEDVEIEPELEKVEEPVTISVN